MKEVINFKKIGKSLLLSLPIIVGSYFIAGVIDMPNFNLGEKIGTVFFYILLNSMFFLTMLTGKVDKYRAVLFISIAITFPLDFILTLFEQRGHFMYLTFSDMINGTVPFCHIVIPQTIIPMIVDKQVVFPGLISKFSYSIAPMVITWLAVSLLIGKGWCSWVCFFGGWEDGFSRINKKKRIKLSPKLIWSSFAVLITVIITSIQLALPTYCMFLCPFKACSEFVEVSTPLVIFQTIIFVILFVGLVLLVPLLSKKRAQCISLCPFGAFQSLVDKINPFTIRIDKKTCVKCGKCLDACPMMSIDEKTFETGKVKINCVKCGKCVDVCPQKSIHFHIIGMPLRPAFNMIAKQLFLYLVYIILADMSKGFIISFIERIVLLITTGSILRLQNG